MHYDDDDEVVALDIEDGRVRGVSLKNSWRDRMTTEELGLTLSDQLARAWAEPMLAVVHNSPQAEPLPPTQATGHDPYREISPAHLAAIHEEVSQISARVRAKLKDPHYFDDVTPPTAREFVSRDGNVTLGHIGSQVVGIELKDEYFRRAPVMAAAEAIERAFEEFYAADSPDDPTVDHDPELTADRAQLRRILEELEAL